MPTISSRRIAFLFRPPTIESTHGWNSTVHLVRRECQETLANIRRTVPEDSFPGRRKFHRLFASAIVTCTAFDLLGKLRYGDECGVLRSPSASGRILAPSPEGTPCPAALRSASR